MLKRIEDSFDSAPDDITSPRGYFEHELKTPLAAIRAAAEILQDYPDLTPDERMQFTSVLLSESSRLTQRVSEVVEQIAD